MSLEVLISSRKVFATRIFALSAAVMALSGAKGQRHPPGWEGAEVPPPPRLLQSSFQSSSGLIGRVLSEVNMQSGSNRLKATSPRRLPWPVGTLMVVAPTSPFVVTPPHLLLLLLDSGGEIKNLRMAPARVTGADAALP